MSAFSNAVRLLGGSMRDPALMKQLYRSASQRMKSEQTAYGLRRDLAIPHSAPEALIPIRVRPIRDEDVPSVLESAESMSLEEKWDRDQRLRLLEAGVGTCFVAVTADDVPCYTQWLF